MINIADIRFGIGLGVMVLGGLTMLRSIIEANIFIGIIIFYVLGMALIIFSWATSRVDLNKDVYWVPTDMYYVVTKVEYYIILAVLFFAAYSILSYIGVLISYIGKLFASLGIGFILILIGFILLKKQHKEDIKKKITINIIRTLMGIILMVIGSTITLISFLSIPSGGDVYSPWLLRGIGLLLFGFLMLPIDHIKSIIPAMMYSFFFCGLLVMAMGVYYLQPRWLLFGVISLFIGIILMILKEQVSGLFEACVRSFRRQERLESHRERTQKKKSKGFIEVKPTEYKKIPEDAIDPFIQDRIHDLIAQGKKIIRCMDCGAYYDKEIWEYYGKICTRTGCSNSET